MDQVDNVQGFFHRRLDVGALEASYLATASEYVQVAQKYPTAAGAVPAMRAFAQAARVLGQRQELRDRGGVPTDVFVFNPDMKYENPDRALTKIGGVPYWPAARPWPKDWLRRPLTFLCQINFMDSKDIVGPLPGDILVMFVGGKYGLSGERFVADWVSYNEGDLIPEDRAPAPRRKFTCQHGLIHRTFDDPHLALGGWRTGPVGDPLLLSLAQIKIGGIPWIDRTSVRCSPPLLAQVNPIDEVTSEQPEMENGIEVGHVIELLTSEITRCAFLAPGGQLIWEVHSMPEDESPQEHVCS